VIKALLFDFDGTLLNTNELIIQTFMHVLEDKFPGKYQPEDCLQFIGPSLRETFSKLTPDEVDEMIQKYRDWNFENHDRLCKEYPGVVETLTELKEMGIRIVIVSTKGRDGIKRGIKFLGIEHLVEFFIGIEDVSKVKPDPEPVLLAIEKLGVEKDEVIMIGDNYHDIEAGHNAGVKSAGVAWSIKGENYLQQFNPDYMLKSMKDLISIVKGEA